MNALFVPLAPIDDLVPAAARCEGRERQGTTRESGVLDLLDLKLSPLGLEVLRALNEAFDEAAETAAMDSGTLTEPCCDQ